MTHSLQAFIPGDWQSLISAYLQSPAWDKLCVAYGAERQTHGDQICPKTELLFKALELTPVDTVNLILLGQDPYHSPGLAQGLAFSIPKTIPMGSKQFPSSLRNINKALQIEGFGSLHHGDLSHWAKQGVLLLNTALSVRLGQAGSHGRIGWNGLIEALIQELSANKSNLVWLLWGGHAQSLEDQIQNQGQHLILRASHPSGLGVYKTTRPFIDPGDQKSCGHFLQSNQYLFAHQKKGVEWTNSLNKLEFVLRPP